MYVAKKKAKHKGLTPQPPSELQLAISELKLYTEAKEAEFMTDSIMTYAVSSEQFAELDDIARADHFTFYTLLKSLISAVYGKTYAGKPKRKEKNK